MKIEEEIEEYKEEKPKNKTITIVAILIGVTILILIGIGILIYYLQSGKLSVNVDGKKVDFGEDTFVFSEENDEIYVSIRDVAPLVGYEAHNGEYKINSEDTNKMYVESIDGKETTSFYLNSKVIAKVAPGSTEDYERIEISEPVINMNGKLYINAEGFMQGFNSILSYDKEENKITIQTLPYLVSYYSSNIANYGYDSISEDFNNQKALIYGMMVAYKSSIQKYGVVNVRNGSEIISPRYNDIQFMEHSREFAITTSNNKVGIAKATGETKINVIYDEIKVLDAKREYYLVKSNSKYGVINANEELIIHIEYDKIGVDDTSLFPEDKIDSQYVLYDQMIPVYQNGKWGFFDVEGNQLTDTEYDDIGCVTTELTDRAVNNALLIGNSKVVVVLKDKYYGGVSTKGDLIISPIFDYICSVTSGGEVSYKLVYNGNDYDAMEYIDAKKASLGYEEEDDDSEEEGSGENNEGDGENQEGGDQEGENQEGEQGGENQEGENQTQENPQDRPEVKEFNSQFEAYRGDRSRGTTKSLIDIVTSSNTLSEQKVAVEYEGNLYTDNISSIKDSLNNNSYNVTVEYNGDSRICRKNYYKIIDKILEYLTKIC